jgi:hypothetical protein
VPIEEEIWGRGDNKNKIPSIFSHNQASLQESDENIDDKKVREKNGLRDKSFQSQAVIPTKLQPSPLAMVETSSKRARSREEFENSG